MFLRFETNSEIREKQTPDESHGQKSQGEGVRRLLKRYADRSDISSA